MSTSEIVILVASGLLSLLLGGPVASLISSKVKNEVVKNLLISANTLAQSFVKSCYQTIIKRDNKSYSSKLHAKSVAATALAQVLLRPQYRRGFAALGVENITDFASDKIEEAVVNSKIEGRAGVPPPRPTSAPVSP